MSYQCEEIETPRPVTCRKAHRCGWCDEQIDVGERASHRVYRWENELHSDWMHMECEKTMWQVHWHYLEGGGLKP